MTPIIIKNMQLLYSQKMGQYNWFSQQECPTCHQWETLKSQLTQGHAYMQFFEPVLQDRLGKISEWCETSVPYPI